MDPAHVDLTPIPPFSPLGRDFFEKDALRLARELVGAYLVVRRGRTVRAVRIVETEAYRGPTDGACHARAGLTRRTRTLFGGPGRAYVYLVYGMHECFNVVCFGEGRGHAVLVRAGEPAFGLGAGARTDGPGRLARSLGITRRHDGLDLAAGGAVFLSARRAAVKVARGPRVGVAYAGPIAERPWRFYDRESAHVSRPPRSSIGLGRP